MKVKHLFNHMAQFSAIKEVDVRFRLKTIDTLKWPDCLPYRGGCKYDNATLYCMEVKDGGILRIDIGDNY